MMNKIMNRSDRLYVLSEDKFGNQTISLYEPNQEELKALPEYNDVANETPASLNNPDRF